MLWAVGWSLGDDKLFIRPKHNIYAFFMILFYLFDSILLFVCQIFHVNCQTENRKYAKFVNSSITSPFSSCSKSYLSIESDRKSIHPISLAISSDKIQNRFDIKSKLSTNATNRRRPSQWSSSSSLLYFIFCSCIPSFTDCANSQLSVMIQTSNFSR